MQQGNSGFAPFSQVAGPVADPGRAGRQLQPDDAPQVSHLQQAPLRTRVS
jgi:hypothetical protein